MHLLTDRNVELYLMGLPSEISFNGITLLREGILNPKFIIAADTLRKRVEVSPTEAAIVACIIQKAMCGSTTSDVEIYSAIYGEMPADRSSLIRTHIHNIVRKLADAGLERIIADDWSSRRRFVGTRREYHHLGEIMYDVISG